MTDPTNPPLWRAMKNAFDREEWETRDGIGLVGEIDAIAAWIEQQQIDDVATVIAALREEAARADREIELLNEAWE